MPKTQNLLEVKMFADTSLRTSSYILHPVLMDFQQVRTIQDGDWERHTHYRDFELIIPEYGNYNCVLDSVELTCSPGEFLLIQPGQSHQDLFQRDRRFYFFHFKLLNPEKSVYISKLFSDAIAPASQVVTLPQADFVNELIALLFRSGNMELAFPVSEGLFLALFRQLMGVFPPDLLTNDANGNEKNHRMLRQVMEVFEAHLASGTLPPGTVEKRLNVSSRTWHRISHELFGVSPKNAFEYFRMSSIHSFMLKHPLLNVKEVACRFNFSDPFYFSRVFRRHFGYPPSQLRDRAKK